MNRSQSVKTRKKKKRNQINDFLFPQWTQIHTHTRTHSPSNKLKSTTKHTENRINAQPVQRVFKKKFNHDNDYERLASFAQCVCAIELVRRGRYYIQRVAWYVQLCVSVSLQIQCNNIALAYAVHAYRLWLLKVNNKPWSWTYSLLCGNLKYYSLNWPVAPQQ